MIPRVNDCCCIFTVRIGCIIIGIICIVFGLLYAANNQMADDDRANSSKMSATAAAAMYIIIGILILIGVLLDIPILVQIGAVVLLVNWIVNFVFALLVFIDNGKVVNIIIMVVFLILFVYFFIVLWSFGGIDI